MLTTLLRGIYAVISGVMTGFFSTFPLGPTGLESAKRQFKYGIKGGLLVGIGSNIADLVYIALIQLGLTKFAHHPKRFDAIFWVLSGGIILFFGFNVLKEKIKIVIPEKSVVQAREKIPVMGSILAGFVITIANPATPVIWLGVSSTLLHMWHARGNLYYLFFGGLVLGILSSFPVQNYLVYKGVNHLPARFKKATSLILGSVLIFLGLVFLIRGIIELLI